MLMEFGVATSVRIVWVVPTTVLILGCTGFNPEFDSAGAGGSGGEAVAVQGCGEPPDEYTVALYSFEDLSDGAMFDSTEAHSGRFVGGTPPSVPGPPGCGNAFEVSEPKYGLVDDSPAFDLEEGSVEVWLRAPSQFRRRRLGVVSRDAQDQDFPGHFSLYVASVAEDEGDDAEFVQGHVVVRLQTEDITIAHCSEEPLSPGGWAHIGVNFGPGGLELYVDGDRQRREGFVDLDVFDVPCGGRIRTGIDGNDNPWVLGARSERSDEGQAEPVEHWLEGAAIDEFRISRARRDF